MKTPLTLPHNYRQLVFVMIFWTKVRKYCCKSKHCNINSTWIKLLTDMNYSALFIEYPQIRKMNVKCVLTEEIFLTL